MSEVHPESCLLEKTSEKGRRGKVARLNVDVVELGGERGGWIQSENGE
jgi:hypothetical protein